MRRISPWGLLVFCAVSGCGDSPGARPDPVPSGPPPVTVTQLSIESTSVITGQIIQGTVTLSVSAPAGGSAVTLASSHAAVTVPAQVTVPAGALFLTFVISTGGVTGAAIDASITATLGASAQTAVLRVTPLMPKLAKLVRFGATSPILGSLTGSAFLELDLPAPPGGASVALRADDSVARVSSPIVIPQGALRQDFTYPTGRPSQDVRVTLTATYGDVSLNATVQIRRGSP